MEELQNADHHRSGLQGRTFGIEFDGVLVIIQSLFPIFFLPVGVSPQIVENFFFFIVGGILKKQIQLFNRFIHLSLIDKFFQFICLLHFIRLSGFSFAKIVFIWIKRQKCRFFLLQPALKKHFCFQKDIFKILFYSILGFECFFDHNLIGIGYSAFHWDNTGLRQYASECIAIRRERAEMFAFAFLLSNILSYFIGVNYKYCIFVLNTNF